MKLLQNHLKRLNNGNLYTLQVISAKRHSEQSEESQTGRTTLSRHPELVSGSQIGRSMVETLGVIAIMGLISIGGLYGYTQAMKRHRANELINEANKRAMMVASQLMTGKEAPESADDTMLGEFTDPIGMSFKVGKNLNNPTKQFKMEIDGVPPDVCEQMQTMMGGVVRNIACDNEEAILTFNNDLSQTPYASDYTYANCPSNFYPCGTTHTCVTSAEECTPQSACENFTDCGEHGSWDEENCECSCGENWCGKTCSSPPASGCTCDQMKVTETLCWPCTEELRGSLGSRVPEEECHRCDNRFLGIYSGSNSCELCSSEESIIKATETECARCNNTGYPRKMDGEYCVPDW